MLTRADCCASDHTRQVHIAYLNGEKVVVKVQRPGLKDLFDIDLKNIRAIVSDIYGICCMLCN